MPKVSVIIPIYGVEKYIERCARSLFEQTLYDIEFIFVNDCTPDNSIQILKQTLSSYPNRLNQTQIIMLPKNKGLANARKIGIECASGEYIIQCDSDDWVDINAYKLMYESAIKEDLDVVVCDIYESNEFQHSLKTQKSTSSKEQYLAGIIDRSITCSLCNKLVKSQILKNNDIQYAKYNMLEDEVLCVQIIYYANKIGFFHKPLYYYYHNPSSICKNISDSAVLKRSNDSIGNINIVLEFLNNKELLLKYKREIIKLKNTPRYLIWPLLLANPNQYYPIWKKIYPELNYQYIFTKNIPFTLRVTFFLTLLKVYPYIYKVLNSKTKIWNRIQVKIRTFYFTWFRKKVQNDISIFCNNCIGAFVAHDFHLPFNSPTVNLMIPPTDFIEFIQHLDEYSKEIKIEEIFVTKSWPEGLLKNRIHINFIHYKTFQEGVDAWIRRTARINRNKMYFILVETDGCTYEDLLRFDKLSYRNKIALTHKPYPNIKCAFPIKGYELKGAVTDCYRYYKILPKRFYDQFNWVKFLNQ